jgi:ATP-dependent Clp protease ATP-binding subunit ClpA
MFERYAEKARRLIFFAKYEANRMEAPLVETEHLLLGLLREDKALAQRFLHSYAAVASIREKIQAPKIPGNTSTSSDPPLARQSKRVLMNAAMEAETRGQSVAPEHILLGVLREEKCLAAELLHEYGLNLASVTDELGKSNLPPARNGEWQAFTFTLRAVNPKLVKGTAAKPGYYHDGASADHRLTRRVRCENMTMAEFAESLPLIAPGYIRGGTVVDATGLEGAWNFTLNFSSAMAWNAPGTVTLFEALEDQLGLRLEKP